MICVLRKNSFTHSRAGTMLLYLVELSMQQFYGLDLIEYRQVIFHLIFCINSRLGNEIVGKFRIVPLI